MLDYKDIIIKHYALHMPGRQIAAAIGASKSGVNDFLKAFEQCESLSYPLPAGITNYGIAELVYGRNPEGADGRDLSFELPDFAEVEKQIDRLIGKVSAKMEEIEVSMKEDVADGKRLNEEKAKELKDSLAQIEEQLTTAKTEISEKVHTENVKCYRNISDLFRSMDERLDKLTVMESRMHPVRIFSLTGMILGIVNLVVLLLVLLVSVGVIAF